MPAVIGGGADVGDGSDFGTGELAGLLHEFFGEFLAFEEGFGFGEAEDDWTDAAVSDTDVFDDEVGIAVGVMAIRGEFGSDGGFYPEGGGEGGNIEIPAFGNLI